MEECSLYHTMEGFPTFQRPGALTTSPTHSATYARVAQQQQQPQPRDSSNDGVANENASDDAGSGRRMSWPRPGSLRMPYRMEEDDGVAESVDLLRMLPESQQQSILGSRPPGPGKDNNAMRGLHTLPSRSRTRLYKEDESEDSSGGLYDEAVLYYNSLCGTHGNREPERIAFLNRPYSTYERNKRNNTMSLSALHDTTCSDITGGAAATTRLTNVAEYCTSKTHSKSCGSLTCPRFEKNRLGRSLKQIYPEHKSKKRKHLKRFKKWGFISAILLGILLAITGIIVAFLVIAPFKMGVHQCKTGYVWCGGQQGCVSPQKLCSVAAQCPGPVTDIFCHSNRSDYRDFKTGLSTFTLSPLLRNSDSLFEEDPGGWVYYTPGSANGSRYITIPKEFTFSAAQEACRDQGGHLAHVNSVGEQVFLQEYLDREIKKNFFPRDTIGFWIGARRPRGSHSGKCMYEQWEWVDFYGRSHGQVQGFAAFAPNKPDNYYAPEECLYLAINNGRHESRYLKWDDAACDIHGLGAIMSVCEVELR